MTPLEIEIALHYWTRPTPYKNGSENWTELDSKIVTQMLARHLLEHQDGQLSGSTPAMRAFVEALQAVPWPTIKWVVEPCPVLSDGCHRSHPHENMNAECERLTKVARRQAGIVAQSDEIERQLESTHERAGVHKNGDPL